MKDFNLNPHNSSETFHLPEKLEREAKVERSETTPPSSFFLEREESILPALTPNSHLKLRLCDKGLSQVEDDLKNLGARFLERRFQTDFYLFLPENTIRLRNIGNSYYFSSNPTLPTCKISKASFETILNNYGDGPRVIIGKERTLFEFEKAFLALDDVYKKEPGGRGFYLGEFVEIRSSSMAQAQAIIKKLDATEKKLELINLPYYEINKPKGS